MKLSFKNYPKSTGLSRVANPYTGAMIKGDGKMIGFISHCRGIGYKVYLHVKNDKIENSAFKNIRLAQQFDGFPDIKIVKEWIKTNWAPIQEKHELYQIPEKP